MTSTAGWVADPEFDAAFAELVRAQSVAFGGVGIANIEGPESKAFWKIRESGAAYLPSIHRLIVEATPAGRVYAATLLTAIDQLAGRRAWEHLATQDDAIGTGAGCLVKATRVSEYAIGQLAKMGVSYTPENKSAMQSTDTAAAPVGVPRETQFPCDNSYPAVDSVTARQEIVAAFHGRPRIVFVQARSERSFVESLFKDVRPPTAVYVRRELRAGRSRGPHFDLYQSVVHRDYPFVATFNIVGDASVESTVLDQALASYYFSHYPQPTETAYTARRLVSELTLIQRRQSALETGRITPGVGLVIPQREFALPVVHEVRPAHGSPGVFLKFLVPRPEDGSFAFVERQGFSRWRPGIDWLHTNQDQPGPTGPRTD